MTEIMFPTSGWNTNKPANKEYDGDSPSLLNVLPFDRNAVLRGAVRSGVSKFSPTQMGIGNPVLLVQQVVVALDPASTISTTLLLEEDFNFVAGTAINSLDVNPADGTTDWHVAGGPVSASIVPLSVSQIGNYLATSSTTIQGVISSADPGSGAWATCTYNTALALGNSFIIEAKISFLTINAQDMSINWGIDISGFTDNRGACLTINKDGSIVGLTSKNASGTYFNNTSFIATSLGLVAGTEYVVQVHYTVSTGAVALYVDGVLKGSDTIASNRLPTGSGIGFGMLRGSSNPGLQRLKNFKIYAGVPLASFRQTSVVAVSNGNIYQNDSGVGGAMAMTSGGTGALSGSIKPQMAAFAAKCYFVDSTSTLKVLDIPTQTVSEISVSTGSETATTLGAYSVACAWHGRLVLAASVAFPMNFIMSRQGDPTDWDYSQTDAAAAVAGNASRAGSIGDPINCLMPWTDDVLIIGGDHSIFKVEGDIASGGQILDVSEAVGTVGPDCWDLDPNGNLYFVGTGGVFMMSAGGGLQNIASDKVRKFFADINRTTHYVVLTWDRDRNGMHIHVTPANSGAATHLFYDATTQGFFPIQYPDSFGPLTSISFDGDGPEDRQLLLACRDGYIRKWDNTVTNDDGTDITSYVFIGPFRPSGQGSLSVLEALETILGDTPAGFTQNDFGLTITVQCGTDAYRALNFPERTLSFTVDQRVARRKRMLQRLSGGTFFFKVSGVSGRLWSMEKLIAMFTQGGLQRRWATNQD